MSSARSKLGQNPLAGRGVGALFPASEESRSTATQTTDISHGESIRAKRSRAPQGATVRHFVNTVTTPSDNNADLVRHTFYLTEAQGQKVKLYALLHRMQISEVIRMLIDDHLKIQP